MSRRVPPTIAQVTDDDHDFYGRQYWYKHQTVELGFPDLTARARADLPERCLHWLRAILKYQLPPARILELGSAHGGLVALLGWAGFEATGLDLSPSIVKYARHTFGIPMLQGPVEQQSIAPDSLDVITLMDVLEHLPDPVGTMRHCLSLLKPDGLLIVQTPKYREGKTYAEMVAEKNPFLTLLLPDEHLHLFSQQSVGEMFRRLGANHLLFEPAIFAHYDMFFVVSRNPVAVFTTEAIHNVLSSTPQGRVIQALLDLDDQFKRLQASHVESEVDRAARLENIRRLGQLLGESERDRAERLGVIQTQGTQMASLQAEVGNLQTERGVAQARLENIRRLEQLLGESERDRAERLGVIQTQGAQVASLQAEVGNLQTERRVAQARLTELQQLLETSEADRAARLENIRRLEQLLGESERDRAERLGVIQTQGAQVASLQAEVGNLQTERRVAQARLTELQQLLETSEADRALRNKEITEQKSLTVKLVEAGVRLENEIASLGEQLKAIGHERDELRTVLAELRQRLESSEADRVVHGEEINKQRRMLEEADSKHKRLQVEISYSKAHAGVMQTTLQRLGHSPTYRVMRALGSWRSLDRSIAALAGTESIAPHPGSDGPQKTLQRVAVDLTPVLPGADNGGAKLLALELVRQLAQLAPACEWILLTSEKGHADLASLDSHNVRRVCVGPNDVRTSVRPLGRARGLSRLGQRSGSLSSRGLLRQLEADVIFCPFTTARFFDSQVPLVSIVYDLQYLTYPEFFSGAERGHRDREFQDVCRFASRLVCISDHVRGAVLQHATVDPARVMTIHISLFHRLAGSQVVNDADVLSRFGLLADRFLLYPANYWPHKNHEMLLTAFGMYRARHPESDLKLVCTGGLSARREELQEAGTRMGLDGELILTEFLPNEEFAALLRACRAMVFPSLFEGFGMPVLEAMAVDKPVLCSNLTSLPEVAGDAAVLFDPRKPTEIVQAIEQVESDPELVAQLIQRGRNRLAAFDDTIGMARRYLHVLQDALNEGNHFTPAVHGVFSDGWTGERVTVMHNPSGTQRYLEMTLNAPPWLPSETLSVRLAPLGRERAQTHVIKRGQTVILRHRLPAAGGALEIQIHPTFQPQAQRIGDDTRLLGCLCRSCRILSPDETVELFAEVPQA